MSEEIVIFGYGPVGRATAERLAKQRRGCQIAQRKPPPALPPGVSYAPADVTNRDSVAAATRGAKQIVLAVGLPYDGALWRAAWPRIMTNLVDVAAEANARVVFVDDLYMYGPQNAPLVETLPLTDYGVKPKVRAEVTRIWKGASEAGRVRFAALRAPDFYGPGVGNSHLGDLAFGALASGKAATLIAAPDMPHDFAYVPDIGRAVVTLLDAPDDAFGQAWHMPCAPIRTAREILSLGAAALDVKPKIRAVPNWALAPLSLLMPFLGEMREMRFLWDRPYRVDWSRFAKRFWSDPTPFEVGAPATALSFREAAQAR